MGATKIGLSSDCLKTLKLCATDDGGTSGNANLKQTDAASVYPSPEMRPNSDFP